MENGMGMLTGEPGAPMGDSYGPSLGRGMGFGSTDDFPKTNGTLSQSANQQKDIQNMNMGGGDADIAPNADHVPGFPQDAFMEGPMMAMDKMVDKPENYGLPPGWSGFMQGMMTFVRVLPPAEYDDVMGRIRKTKPAMRDMPEMKMDRMRGNNRKNK